MQMRLIEALEASSFDDELKNEVLKLFNFIDSVPDKDLLTDIAQNILQRIVDSQIMQSASDRIKMLLERGQFGAKRFLDDLSIEKEKRRIGVSSEVRMIKPFGDDMSKYMLDSEVYPTGIEFVDILLRGGPWKHDLMGLLAPSGGGKTTFAIQLAVSWVRQDVLRHSILLSYEQPLEGDLHARMCSAITGLPVTTFRGKTKESLHPEVLQKLDECGAALKDRFHFVDLSGARAGVRGIEDIKAMLSELNIPENGPPTLVIIDWLMPCIQRAMLGAGVSMDGEHLRLFGSRFMDDLKILKNNWNIVLLVNHQLNCEKAKASSAKKPDWTDAAEWKAFAWYMDVCFALGALSEDHVGWFVASKVRSTAASDRMVKLKGDYIKFVEADNEFMMSHGKIVPKVKEMDNIDVSGRRGVDVSHLKGLDQSAAAQFEG
jgi:RecA/RadA recombinase